MTAYTNTRAHGLRVYTDLPSALRDGYHVYDRTPAGYLIRKRTPTGYGFALVVLRRPHLGIE